MLATPRCSPPCSPELNFKRRCSSVGSETDLDDLVLTDLQLANWGEALRLGVFKEEEARAARIVPEEDLATWSSCSTGGSDMANSANGTEMVSFNSGLLRGSVALKVTPEASERTLEDALCQALKEVLLPATGPKVGVNLSSSGSCSRCSLEGSSNGGEEEQLTSAAAQEVEFDFEITVADPNDMVSAREVLRLEAAFAGARRLLPTIASALPPGGPMAVRLQMRLQDEATDASHTDALLLFSLNANSCCSEPGTVGLDCGPWGNCFSHDNLP